jgi:putative ATP-binding cassette transporter
MADGNDQGRRQYLLARYWEAALGFWREAAKRKAWLLTIAVFTIAVVNLWLAYRMNVWHRVMFDALENRDATAAFRQSLILFPLILAMVAMGCANTFSKMTLQREWRSWLNSHLLDKWLKNGRYYQLNLMKGDHSTPEYRIADDLRLSVDAPVDLVLGVFTAVISALTFIGVLWFIGGELEVPLGRYTLRIPGFLVVAAVIYSSLASGTMIYIARGFVPLAENKNQAEANYRYALTRLRENGESIALLGGDAEERATLESSFAMVRRRWRAMMMQSVRTTIVAGTSNGFAPIIPILLCAPKYVAGTMTLGQMMQAASAFVTVQVAFSWLVENYPRLADWTASAHRVASLLVSLDRLEDAEMSDSAGRIMRKRAEDGALRLRDVCVTLNDGNAVVNEADIEITPGEKVLVVGESGTGKSMLVRAIAGLWPWGKGEILVEDAGLFLMPQQPYVPLGTLRHAATYPLSTDDFEDRTVRKTIEEVGLGHFLDRLDEETEWDNVLSGGEKQRLAFARVLLQRPDLIVMDEATAALDPLSQGELMQLLLERLPRATIVSVAHRVELEAYHTRKLLLEYRPEGARLVGDDPLQRALGRLARFLSKVWSREQTAKVVNAAEADTVEQRSWSLPGNGDSSRVSRRGVHGPDRAEEHATVGE